MIEALAAAPGEHLRILAAPPSPGPEGLAASTARRDLQAQMLNHCEVLLQHAMATGLPIPPVLVGRLDSYLAMQPRSLAPVPVALTVATGPASDGLPGAVAPIEELAEICRDLTLLVAPATPAAILLFAQERRLHPRLSAIGAVPLARHFLMLSAASLLTTLLVSLAADVNADNMAKSFLHSEGWPLLLVELFLLSAASLGSCFAILQKLNGYITAGSYDPKYQATYWTKWVMGVISGVLISQLLYSWLVHAGGPAASSRLPDLGQPTLALVGGYSAGLVHRLLNRVMIAIETLFAGKT